MNKAAPPNMTPYIRKVAASSERLYELRIPFADGRTGYYKLSVNPLKEVAFDKACKAGATVNLTAFGTILESYFLPSSVAALENGGAG